MTRETEIDDNDPEKITICLEDDEYNERKKVFEKGLSALLANQHFLLLYVPDNGSKMQVIRPSSNLFHRKRMIKRINDTKRGIPSFYYALSHLWGLTENDRYHWNDIKEYVDDEEGQPVKPVSMRHEKRDTLLALLKDHPDSYWWIDVLCARTDTPLDIMGDIYACCLECIAMIDCDPSLIPKIHTMSVGEKEMGELLSHSSRYPRYERICKTKALQLCDLLHTFLQSQWWQRVWTWQEMALPCGDVRFMAETSTHQQLQTNTITLDELIKLGAVAYTLDHTFVANYKTTLREDIKKMGSEAKAVCNILGPIRDASECNDSRISGSDHRFMDVIYSMKNSTRRCYDPADYVYGVLGMMQIQIPRMVDPCEVWRHFLAELDNCTPHFNRAPQCIDRAQEIDLREAETIGDVYKKLYRAWYGDW